MKNDLNVLVITSEWPTNQHPERAPFLLQQIQFLKREGIKISVFNYRGNFNPINYIKAWNKIRHLPDWKRSDIIHAHWGQSGLIAIPSKIPLVVTFHGSDLMGIVNNKGKYLIKGKILKIISRIVSRYANQNIVVSNKLKNLLPKIGNINIIPCGIDFNKFILIDKQIAREKLGLPDNEFLVLFAANMNNPIKRFNLAKNTVNRLKTDYSISLVTLNNVPHDTVPIYMNACDMLLVTSLHEGGPLVVKEALACNLPIASVDVGDVREQINNIQGCVLFKDDQETSIEAGIMKIYQDRCRLRSRELIRNLDEQILVKEIIGVYEKALINK